MEGDILEPHFARNARQCGSTRRINDGNGFVEHRHAVIDDADILEEAGDFPHDPLRHRLHAQGEADRHCHRAGADEVTGPEKDACARDQENEQRIVEIDNDVETGDEAHLSVDGIKEAGHRVLRVGLLAARVGKELHGLDVGVGINDAAGHHRAGIGLCFGDLAEAGHEVPQQAGIDREP